VLRLVSSVRGINLRPGARCADAASMCTCSTSRPAPRRALSRLLS